MTNPDLCLGCVYTMAGGVDVNEMAMGPSKLSKLRKGKVGFPGNDEALSYTRSIGNPSMAGTFCWKSWYEIMANTSTNTRKLIARIRRFDIRCAAAVPERLLLTLQKIIFFLSFALLAVYA
jgi:hypothetical protein